MIDPGLAGREDRPVEGIDNGFLAGYRVRFDEAGPDGLARASALLRYAQDVAWRHSEALGFDRQWYVDRGRWWVVRGVELDVLEPISMGQTVRVSTAVIGHRRIWARRLSGVQLADGRLAARLVTDWVLLDERRRLVRIPSDFGLSFLSPELSDDILRVKPDLAFDHPPARPHARAVRHMTIPVRPRDLDPMGHVNNAIYVDWLDEALAAYTTETAAASTPATERQRWRLEYLASAEPGQEVDVAIHRAETSWTAEIRSAGGPVLLRAEGWSLEG
ncbi:MAG TPA: acyl-ACP thioesterase domain-containing protein [Candidatus Limnocylindrales bacterium]|nr:acyl-ACP thioesterase domain-containing protein [Candidatus Limnocylindrales bacterium]